MIAVSLAYLVVAIWHSLVVGTHDYEAEYLILGSGWWRGALDLYGDDFTSQWMPLPFWVFGGLGLWQARTLSILIGLAALWMAMGLASSVGGKEVGILTGLLIVTHGGISGSLMGTVHFEGLVIIELCGLVWCLLSRRRVAAMVICNLIFLTKPNYWPAIPFALVYAIWQHEAIDWKGRWEPLKLLGLALIAPAIFFADPQHWKILAYTPLGFLVEPHWQSWFHVMEPGFWRSDYTDGTVLGALSLFARRFFLWGILLGAGLIWGWRRCDHSTVLVAGLFLVLFSCQFVIMGPWVKQTVGYMTPVMPLVAGQIALLAWPRR
jgi:hypothetical protein